MRVGLISFHSFYQPGGVKRHVLGLKEEFKKRGIYSKIIAPRRNWLEDYGKDVILLGTSFPLSFSGGQSDFNINFNPLAIDRVLKKEKFDVLHFHNFGFPSTWQILEKSESLNILTFHANIGGSKFLKRFPIFLYLLNKIVQWKIDGIIGVASLNLKVFKDFKGPKVVVPNGIDLEEFNPRVPKLKKFCDGKINILFVGRIEERKGLIYLLKAFKILTRKFSNTELPSPSSHLWERGGRRGRSLLRPKEARGKKRMKSSSPLRLIIVGEGELKEYCQNYVKENNLKEVCFEGQITGPKLPSYYRTCDIYCSPAIYGESFGIVLIEAMASSVPVVAFANEGYKRVLEKGKGKRFLVRPKDYKTLAKKLEILIKNPKIRKEMGEWGIREAKKYSWPKIADQVLDFYQLCLREKGERKKAGSFFLGKSFKKIFSKIYNKNILNWLKKLKI